MRIAIAGTGDLAKYFVEELHASSYDVVVLTRTSSSSSSSTSSSKAQPKPWYSARHDAGVISLRSTDYTVPSLVEQLRDCDGLVSAIQDGTPANVVVHLALLEACRQTRSCRRFIPSEYIGDVDRFPTQPLFYPESHQPVRDALAAQQDVVWTLVMPGWLADYVVAPKCRYIRDIGDLCPIAYVYGKGEGTNIDTDTNTNTNTNIHTDGSVGRTGTTISMLIPGTGNEPISCTAARDVARAVAALFKVPYRVPSQFQSSSQPQDQPQQDEDQDHDYSSGCHSAWDPITYIEGQATTWNEVKTLLQSRGHSVRVTYRPVTELEETVAQASLAASGSASVSVSEDDLLSAQFGLWSTSGATRVPRDTVVAQRSRFFPGLAFRTLAQLLDASEAAMASFGDGGGGEGEGPYGAV